MDFLELSLPSLAENVALDEALLLEAEAGGGEVLRIWDQQTLGIVLGSGGKIADDVDVEMSRRDGVPIVRRSSGGGTVLLGPGCVCYSLVLAYSRAEELTQISSSYRWIMAQVVLALGLHGVEQQGISDLAINGRKFSGNAQQRKRDHLLHHGTILYAMDLTVVGRYLREPERQPDYRERRGHEDFVRNVDVGREQVVSGLRETWGACHDRTNWPASQVARLVAEKYATEEWTCRR